MILDLGMSLKPFLFCKLVTARQKMPCKKHFSASAVPVNVHKFDTTAANTKTTETYMYLIYLYTVCQGN